ncbi:virulence factor family protein [Ciceribacter ferrooxidans]|uniref:Virulence factor family protein n=1 Tax=Ciceribacter ferrooxidans TaxID=2509717 RepID=A0A4Q2T0I3_9HYPH|nr:AcvB/VirJ family lysyl-phosphatidylglycerol hydrolase [Ciceribacter ferrooxidans]RYC12126.1 virulence factor family protein [Ciceribacter ferrooxidans]
MKSLGLSGLGLAAGLLVSCGIAAAQAPATYQPGMIPANHILLPEGEVRADIFLISDAGGWGDNEEQQARALVDKGAIVVGIDLPAYLKALRADDSDCVYMISDVESLAHQVQRAAGTSFFNLPIVAGIGEGAALALAMIAQSPAATIGEAIAVAPVAGIPLDKELCTPATKERIGDRMVYGLTDGPLPAPVTVLFSPAADKAGRDHVASLVKDHSDIEVRDVEDSAGDALAQTLGDRVDAGGNADDPLGLPLTLLEATPAMDTMAIIYSGDGGWRDLDRQVGAVLQEKGIPVVGVDSLHYFWSKRTPQETAEDLARIIDTYRRKWKVRHVLLAGYSFGADVLPATYNLLPPDDRARVTQVTLMALSHQVDYEISVEGWLGVSGDGAGDPVDDIAKIDPKRVQCIYGTEEDDDPCPTLKTRGVESIGITGGHHFDEDYEALAGRILASLKTRLGE